MKVSISIEGKQYPTRKEKEKECLEALQHKPTTLAEEFTKYIGRNVGRLAETTLAQYAHIRDMHFERIMGMAVGCIGKEELQASFDDEAERGWKKKTLENYKYCIKNVLRDVRPDFNPEIVIHAKR